MNWDLFGLRGTRDQVKAAVAASKAPADVKAFLYTQIDSLPAGVSACKMDAYCQDIESKSEMRLTRNIQATIVAVKV
jgi:hypothetical protein